MKIFRGKILLSLMLFCFPIYVHAVEQQAKIWPGFDLMGPLFGSKNFVYDLNGQARYNFTNEVYDETRLEGALGYRLTKTIIFWVGDRHTIPHSQ
jgi:hypothetical protein